MARRSGSLSPRIRLLFIGTRAETLRAILRELRDDGVAAFYLPSPSELATQRLHRFDSVFLFLPDSPERVVGEVSILRREFPRTPLWVIGRAERKDLIVAALRAGANGYLTEPLTVGEFQHLLGLDDAQPQGIHNVLRAEDLAALYEVAQSVSTSHELSDILNMVLEQALRVTEAKWGLVALMDPDVGEMHLEAGRGLPKEGISERLPLGEGILGRTAMTGLPYLCPDVRRDVHYREAFPNTASLMAVPLRYKEEVMGVLALGSPEREAFGERDVHLLMALATQAAIAIENIRVLQQAEQAVTTLADIGRALTEERRSPGDLIASVLELILERALEVTGASRGSLQLLNRETGELAFSVVRGVEKERWQGLILRLGKGITGYVAQTGRPYLCPDVRRDPHYVELIPGVLSELAVPLMEKQQVLGVLNVESRRAWAFTPKHQRLLMALADQAAMALKSVRAYGELLVLHAIAQHLARPLGDNSLQELLQTVVRAIAEHLNAQSCSIFLYDEERGAYVLRATQGLPESLIGNAYYLPGEGFTGWIAAYGQPLRVANPQQDPRWLGKYSERTSHQPVAAYLGVPILAQGKVMGVLRVVDKIPTPASPFPAFTQEEEQLLQMIAGQLGIVLENALLVSELKRASRIKSEFISNLSHELKTPLTSLRLAAQILLRDHLSPERRRRFLTIVQMEVERYARLINKIIYLSRIEAGQVLPNRRPTHLQRVFQRAVAVMELEAQEKGLSFVAESQEDLPPLEVDADMLEQAMLNLLSNAVKYTPQGGWVRASLRREGEAVVFEVQDNGPGIPQEEQRRVFEKFFRGSSPYAQPEAEGVGLGLAITRHIVEVHGGQIELESQVGWGTCVRFRLPLDSRGQEAQANSKEKESPSA